MAVEGSIIEDIQRKQLTLYAYVKRKKEGRHSKNDGHQEEEKKGDMNLGYNETFK